MSYVYVSYEKNGLYFIFILHAILKKSVWTKRPGFYALQEKTAFSSSPQLKQLIVKNTCEYCDLHDLWSAWGGDPR